MVKKAFLFIEADAEIFLVCERLSLELLAVGEHMASGNPLEEDKRWSGMAGLCRSTMKLSAYTKALSNLAVQTDQLNVTPEDRALLDSLLVSISELMFSQPGQRW